MPEKRNFTRAIMRGTAVLKAGTDAWKGELLNVSFGGFCGYFIQELLPGTAVTFALTPEAIHTTLEGKGTIKTVQQIVHYGTRYFRTGVQFTEVDKYMIIAFINAHEDTRKQQKKSPAAFDPNWGPL